MDTGLTMMLRPRVLLVGCLLGLLAGTSAIPVHSAVPIADTPLFLPQDVPGNLILTPSVEWPTISVAAYKNPESFARGDRYTGLFDAKYCYRYNFDTAESKRHFEPMANAAADGSCSTANHWSGKFLNWATTQAIEPFRIAMTGGYRVRDTTSETWIEKAWHDGQGGTTQFPDFKVTSSQDIDAYTPAAWGALKMRIQGLGNKMRFTKTGDLYGGVTAYNPGNAAHVLRDTGSPNDPATVYEVSVRVMVCKVGFVSSNCKQYGTNWKPEGLIQEYSDRLRYSVFGYLNDSSEGRDGAALRARQKFVGPLTYAALQAPANNPAREWDATTGVLFRNPDAADATATGHGVADSGIINYLNKFGQMPTEANGTTIANHKSLDPVSEMYYAALRYLRNLGNVPEYTNGIDYKKADGFPVITEWDDPIAYGCEANVILGIGDVFTHRDKNLPGPTSSAGEPAKPAQVAADTAIDVVALTNRVALLEGIGIPTGGEFTGRQNSAFIAGLAYDAHVRDQRIDLTGVQTASTYWVDVREKSGTTYLQPRAKNQYWLAAKYGGFRVPANFDPVTHVSPLADALWWNSGEYLETGDKRPDNFFVASDPDAMINGLKQAFAKIASEVRQGSGAALATTSSQLEAGTRLFQTRFWSGTWNGDLTAYPLNPDTGEVGSQLWSAAQLLDAKDWTTRKIYMTVGSARGEFNSSNASTLATGVADYVRGKRSDEGYSVGKLRPRSSVLGDMIHSQSVFVPASPNAPTRRKMVYVGANDGMLHGFDADTGEEVFAFVPKAALPALNAYAQFNPLGYQHKYLVDGEITVAEVGNRTYLVATTGRGRPGVFALDVTNPDDMSVLWDKTGGSGGDIPALGNALGKPVIAQTGANAWSVVLGNGPNSQTGAAALLVMSLPAGAVKVVDLGGTDNGLSGVAVWRPAAGEHYTTVYAGDLSGKLWKVSNIQNNNPSKLTLFNAGRAITVAPQVANRPRTAETWVFFGTGRYLGAGDIGGSAVESWYGLIDGNTTITGKSQLLQRQITAEGTTTGASVRAVSEGTASQLAGKKGWYIDLVSPTLGAQGERIVAPLIFQGLALVATTRIPDATNPCGSGSKGWVMAIDPFTGARFGTNGSYFDANNDGVINDQDGVPSGNTPLPNAGIGLDSGAAGIISVGKRIYAATDTGGLVSAGTERLTGTVERVSWREMLLQMKAAL